MRSIPLTEEILSINEDNGVRFRFLLDLIPIGVNRAIHMKELADFLSTDERSARDRVLRCKQAGCVICSLDDGYFIPEDISDLEAYYHRVRSTIESTLKGVSAAERVLIDHGRLVVYQESLFPSDGRIDLNVR